ncbi:MAG: hypothetical protein IJO98_00835 [Clostridia bacterium]|nr:hypothetical protein [Clostridia bacterium]
MKQNDIRRVLKENAPLLTPHLSTSDNILSHIHSKRRTSFKKRRTLLIVVVLMILSMVVAGAKNPAVMHRIYEWSNDELIWNTETATGVSVDGRTFTQAHRDTWGDEFIDALEENDVNILLPTWKPEGLVLEDLTVIFDETDGFVRLSYQVENKQNVVLSVGGFPRNENSQWTAGGALPLDTDKEPKIFRIEGREVLWGKNAGTDSIVWTDLCANVQLFGEFGDENAMKIIESIE